MIPLHDDNPTRTLPIVTVSILIACVLAFLWQLLHEPQVQELLVTSLGLIPAALLGDFRPAQPLYSLPPSITLVTSMFLHGGWMHLIGNMLYLWIFGNNVEDAIMRASSGSICSAARRGAIRHINPAVPIASVCDPPASSARICSSAGPGVGTARSALTHLVPAGLRLGRSCYRLSTRCWQAPAAGRLGCAIGGFVTGLVLIPLSSTATGLFHPKNP